MAGYVMKMSILVPNINRRGLKDLSFKLRHKAHAKRYVLNGAKGCFFVC